MGLCCICFVVATKLTTAANAIVLQYAGSVYVAVLAPKMLGEPTRKKDWYFLSLVLSGIYLFFMDDLSMRGIASAYNGRIAIPPVKPVAASCAVE
jgi:drug/metabolite transporter (DMT)-like permease